MEDCERGDWMSWKLEGNGHGWTNGQRAWVTTAATLLASLAFAGSASAAVFTPTTFLDEGAVVAADCPADAVESSDDADCSLREAVEAANDLAGADEVVLAAGRYEVNSDSSASAVPVEVGSGTITIRGAGARQTTVDGNGSLSDETRVFSFSVGSKAELRSLAITGGVGSGSSNGGAIKVRDGDGDAEVTMTRVWLYGNTVENDGGAISNRGKLTLVQSLVSGNTAAGSGGGIENDDELTLVNTTVSGNKALGQLPEQQPQEESLSEQYQDGEGNGGGIDNDGDNAGFYEEEPAFLHVEGSTIAFNEAKGNGGGVSTAVSEEKENETTFSALSFTGPRTAATFHNSIVSDNGGDGDDNCSGNQPAGSGEFTSSQGHNLEDGTSCLFTAEGDMDDASKLGALADNGGETDTHALAADAPAIDAAESDGCLEVDQRGTERPQGDGCDIGAYERTPTPTPTPRQEAEPLPPRQTPAADIPRCLDGLPPITGLNREGLKVDGKGVTLRGTSRDQGDPCQSGVQRVEVSMARVSGTDLNCRFLRRSSRFLLSPFVNCRQPIRFIATGTNKWAFRFRMKLPPGQYRAQARGYDQERNKETPKKRRNIVTFTVR